MKLIMIIPLEKLLEVLNVSQKELESKVRTRRLSDARSMIAAFLSSRYYVRQHKLAEIFCKTQPAVCAMIARHKLMMQVDYVYKLRYEYLVKEMS